MTGSANGMRPPDNAKSMNGTASGVLLVKMWQAVETLNVFKTA